MEIYRTLVDEYPHCTDHWQALGDAWLDCTADAVDRSFEPELCFGNVLRSEPNSISALYGFGMINQHKGKYTAAIDAYLSILEIDPENVDARFRLFMLFQEKHISASLLTSYLYASKVRPHFRADDVTRDFFNSDDLEFYNISQVAILRGYLSDLPFDELAKTFSRLESKYFWPPNARAAHFNNLPERERLMLLDVIDSRLAEGLAPALSNWPKFGFLPHRHNPDTAWQVQFQEYGEVRGTPLHQDHPVNGQQSDWASFWFPMTPCGPGIAPTLRILPAKLLKPIDCEEPFARINPVPSAWLHDYFDHAMIPVTAQPGDLVIFGRYVLHDTLVEPSMPNRRISIDVRHTIGPARLSEDFCRAASELLVLTE
jgi:hypothetical protein